MFVPIVTYEMRSSRKRRQQPNHTERILAETSVSLLQQQRLPIVCEALLALQYSFFYSFVILFIISRLCIFSMNVLHWSVVHLSIFSFWFYGSDVFFETVIIWKERLGDRFGEHLFHQIWWKVFLPYHSWISHATIPFVHNTSILRRTTRNYIFTQKKIKHE